MSNHHGMPGLYPADLCNYNHVQNDGDRFGRMFGHLPGLYTDPQVLIDLGMAGGPLQAGARAAKSKTVPVGQVFFGQFIDHDVTLDVASSFEAVNQASAIPNTRTPTLDLDCVYGSGPEASNYLYEANGAFAGVKLVHGADDLQRNGQDVALIGDFRNDENRIVSQLQLGMVRVHNFFCDELSSPTLSGHDLYVEARKQTTWHYQWSVVNDFLVHMCGDHVIKDILSNGRQFYNPKTPFIPVEFSVAAYRFGHSMAPLKIQIQAGGDRHDLFGGALGAFSPVSGPHEIVDWSEVFLIPGTGSAKVQAAEKCDPKLAAILLDLPFISGTPEEKSLATRNLLRGQSFMLPSGEQVAADMGRPEHEIAEVSEAACDLHGGLDKGTPLWLYVLLEGATLGRGGDPKKKGEGLGPVGGRIVAEVIIGLLECDDRSWLSTNRSWAPAADRQTIGELLQLSPTPLP